MKNKKGLFVAILILTLFAMVAGNSVSLAANSGYDKTTYKQQVTQKTVKKSLTNEEIRAQLVEIAAKHNIDTTGMTNVQIKHAIAEKLGQPVPVKKSLTNEEIRAQLVEIAAKHNIDTTG
ncbi:MAG: hypothetical protein ACYCYI_00910, partial [Saccharofermentanales bacterium]